MAIFAGHFASQFCDPLRDHAWHVGRGSMWRKTGGGSMRRAAVCRTPRMEFPYSLKVICGTGEAAYTNTVDYLPGMELGSPVGGDSAPLLYKPYMDHLWMTLVRRAPNFRSLTVEPDIMRRENKEGAKRARVFNWLSSSSSLHRIRLTYFDGGSAVQAFNSLLYPDFRYDVPLLGIDLLSFGTSKILFVIDFTPLSQDSAYLDKYTSQLAPLRAEIAEHCGRMSTRFYDENQFFSKQLVFYRSMLGAKDPKLEVPNGLLFKTYASYIDKYLQILQSAQADEDPLQMQHVALRQNAYNQHSEERDPAVNIFSKYFGKEWSERFTRDFLFVQITI